MSLNLNTTFYDVDTILNDLLSKYKSLKFIGFDQTDDNKPYYLNTVPITKGFYYKEKRMPITKEVVCTLKIVPENDTIADYIKSTDYLELTDEDNNFLRFRFKTEKEPHPPNYEWWFLITPNRQETTVIT